MARRKYETGAFYHYANIYRQQLTEEDKIEAIDFTTEFWIELQEMIKNGELVNMNINAPPTHGKSTVAFAIADQVLQLAYGRKITIHDIDRDQQEFTESMKNPKLKNTVRVIDEWNELENTGENSTIETATYNYFSDVMAQRMVHKISCSPKDNPDKNSLIFLEVMATDKKRKETILKLYYNTYTGGIEYKQIIGHIIVNVKDILNQEWYQIYRKRKFEKMELLTKHGIQKPRDLIYNQIKREIVNDMKDMAKIKGFLKINLIKSQVKTTMRKNKTVHSILGHDLLAKEVHGILSAYEDYYMQIKKRNIIVHKIKKLETEGKQTRTLTDELIVIEMGIKKAKNILNEINKEMEELYEIKKKYDAIEEQYEKIIHDI